MKTTHIAACIVAAASLLAAPAALAQAFPSKPIRLVVGASPGGSTDTLAREIALDMTWVLGQTVIVDNKPGAGGNLAAQEVARAAPDGHTLLVSFTSHTMNASLFKKLPYDPLADFTPITLLAKVSSVLVTRPDFAAKDARDMVARGKASKQGLSFAVGGIGSSLHMDTYEFAKASGVTVAQIPFKGTAPALGDVLAGHVDLMFAPVAGARPLVQSGKLRALAVTGPKRLAALPDVPSITEAVPSFTTNFGWFGVLGPAKMPADVTSKLHAAIVQALQSPKLKGRLEGDGSAPDGSGTAEFTAFLKADMKHWASQVQAFGIQPE